MTADYAALLGRVADLEQQMRHILPAKSDLPANHAAYSLAAEHGEMRAQHADMREQLSEHGERLDRITRQLGEHGELLAEILRRLPPESEQVAQ